MAFVRSGIWTHASIWRPETSATEKNYLSWVWRLRPLGHSDTFIQGCEGQLYPWRRSNGKIKDPKSIIYCLIISLNSISSLVNPLQKATSFHFKRASVRSGIWTHASIRRPETSATEKDYLSWVWRLRPLGHSDMNTQWWEWYFYQWSWSDGKIKDPNYYLFSHYFFKFNF